MAVVEWNLGGCHEGVFPVFRDVAHLRPYAVWALFADHDVVGELLAGLIVQLGNHLQLAERAHGTVSVEILHDSLHLLGRQKRKLLELFTGDLVQVELVGG